MPNLVAIEFPPVAHLIEWPDYEWSGGLQINKVVLLMLISAVLVFAFFMAAGSQKKLVPTGIQNAGEIAYEFVRDQIVLQTMGRDGLPFTSFLVTFFSFILTCNLIGLLPGVQMPAMARMALPAFMAVLVWLVYMFMGILKNGFFGYFKSFMFPPGVPKGIYILLTPIEFLSVIFIRPFALAVRLFANLLAGHLILVSFAVLSHELFKSTYVGAVAPFALLIALTGFELLVAFLQAYIFTILAAVFIGGAMHPEH